MSAGGPTSIFLQQKLFCFVLFFAFCFIKECLLQIACVIDALGFFLLLLLPLLCFETIDRFEDGEFTDVTQTRPFARLRLAGWRHRKLYVYIAASFLVCPGWFLCCCVTPGGNCSTLTFLPFDLILLLWYLWADATYLFSFFFLNRPYCVKHRVLIFIKDLFFKKKWKKKYFVHNVKPESVYFGKNVVSEIIASSKQKQLLKKTFTINNMKCSAVRKDFWCLTNKVNQIEAFLTDYWFL